MPNKCCVPGCKSNYINSSELNRHVPMFSFPKNEQLKQLWLRKIRRLTEPTKYSFVCIKHFDERFIIREISFRKSDGTELRMKKSRPSLVSNAYPTLFNSSFKTNYKLLKSGSSYGDKYLTVSRNVARKRTSPFVHPNPTPLRNIKKDLPDMTNSLQLGNDNSFDSISSFGELLETVDERLSSHRSRGWCYVVNNDQLIVTNLSLDSGIPTVNCAIKVNSDLSVKLIMGTHEATSDELEIMGWNDEKISSWNQMQHCMQLLKSSIQDTKTPLANDLSSAIDVLKNVFNDIKGGKHNVYKERDLVSLSFIIEQLELIGKKAFVKKYSCEIIMWCLSIMLQSPTAYNILRDSAVINVPQERTLKRIMAEMNTVRMTSTHFNYLEKKAKSMAEDKRMITLQLYDIPVTSPQSFEDGPFSSFVTQPGRKPTSIQVFLVSSVFSNFKEIALIIPLESNDGDFTFLAAKNIIVELEKVGFVVLCIIADNKEMYRTAFTKFSGKAEMNICVPHPVNSKRPLFLLFDPAHILKCIRDDWIDQKLLTQTLVFPDPNPNFVSSAWDNRILEAHFSVVKSLYEVEKQKDWTQRKARRLNYKSITIQKGHRDNIDLVLNVFDEGTVKGLEELGPNEPSLLGWEDTAVFVKTILSWWAIINSSDSSPDNGSSTGRVDSLLDPCMKLFDDLIVWLNQWDELLLTGKSQCNVAKLSNETSSAFQHTLHALREIVIYLLTEIGVKNVCLGRFQKHFLGSQFFAPDLNNIAPTDCC